ncbi:MAG: hypothetical protein KKA73_22600 [Chloroflexi bacterium]|nr:hypothetical protein [Chloroflexota bacterium]MBU1750483.1 hypothetical protein [Chloroflexota bacterium]MBU1878012.1 hypothetical protein [Chloroflexota bacterium]
MAKSERGKSKGKGKGKKAPDRLAKRAEEKTRLRKQMAALTARVTALEERVTALESTPAADPLLDIPGIGPRYANRLHAAGIQGVTDLGAADPVALAEQTGIPAKVIRGWIDATAASGQ